MSSATNLPLRSVATAAGGRPLLDSLQPAAAGQQHPPAGQGAERHRPHPAGVAAERVAGRIGGALLFALAAYVVLASGWNLWTQSHGEFSAPGFIVTLMAIPVMRYLAGRKIELAKQLGSRALRADAMESVTCGWLSVVAVVSLGVQAVSRVWWIDSVGSLAIVWLLVKEGREAWRGECCADC